MVCSQLEIKHYDNFHLTNFNTLRIKSVAKQFWIPDNYGEMISLFKKFKKEKVTPIVIGNGSNILFSSKGIKQPIIYTGNIKSVFILGNSVEVEAGLKAQAFSTFLFP